MVDRVRPEVEDSLRGGALHKLGGYVTALLLTRAGVKPRIVPRDHWAPASALARTPDQSCAQAVVACPCGAVTTVELAMAPTPCECERWFFYDGSDVWVFNSPASGPA